MRIIVTGFSNIWVRKMLNNSTHGPSGLFWYDHQAWAQDAKFRTCFNVYFLSCHKIIWYLISCLRWTQPAILVTSWSTATDTALDRTHYEEIIKVLYTSNLQPENCGDEALQIRKPNIAHDVTRKRKSGELCLTEWKKRYSPCTRHEGLCRSGDTVYALLTSALDWFKLSASGLGRLSPWVIEEDIGWAPEQVWRTREDKYFCLCL
jgi:hypothetical protein